MRSDHNRIRLRPLRREDSDTLYTWITDRDLVVLNAPYRTVSEHQHERWLENAMKDNPDSTILGIEMIEGPRLIGSCQLLNIHPIHRNAELQIRIGNPADRAKGFGSEAIQLLCRCGFHDFGLHRIYLHVFASNLPAINAYSKCGFKQEGEMKEAAYIDGKWEGVLVMGLLKSQL